MTKYFYLKTDFDLPIMIPNNTISLKTYILDEQLEKVLLQKKLQNFI